MEVPFLDLKAQYASIKPEIDQAIAQVVESSRFVGGETVTSFERAFAEYCDSEYAVGVANGTDALQLALLAVGVGPGDEVITAANTFIATAAAIETVGARTVLVDIDSSTYTMDPSLLEDAITERTRAIIPVHLYGQPADMQPIMDIAERHGLYVIEDAAQAQGAEYNGRRVGSIGHVACFSFYPGKNLGAYGDAGAVTTNSAEIAHAIERLGDHGRTSKYEHAVIGFNSRLDALQASVLEVKLRHLDDWNKKRQHVARWYDEMLAAERCRTPVVRSGSSHVFHLYVIACDNRDELQAHLEGRGIGSGVHYPLPLHLQPALKHLGYRDGDMPRTEHAAHRILSLPLYPEMTREQVGRVCEVIRESVPVYS